MTHASRSFTISHPSTSQKGEINYSLAATIAAIVIGIAAFMYAHDSSQRVAAQQATIDQLKATVASQQEMLDKAGTDIMDLQTALQTEQARLDAATKDLQAIKDAERKRAEKAALAAKQAAAKAKPKAKAPVKKSTTTKKKK